MLGCDYGTMRKHWTGASVFDGAIHWMCIAMAIHSIGVIYRVGSIGSSADGCDAVGPVLDRSEHMAGAVNLECHAAILLRDK